MQKIAALTVVCLAACTRVAGAQSAGSPIDLASPVSTEAAVSVPSEPAPVIYPGPRRESKPGTALEVLERYVEEHSPGLEDPNRRMMRNFFIGGSTLSVGCAVLALIVTPDDRESEDEEKSYFWGAALGGFFQGLYLNTTMGMGLSYLVVPEVDIRAEYGSLLDVEAEAREDRAVLILRKIARRERQRRGYGALFALLSTALPVGTYYLGTALMDPNPNTKDVGYGYTAGIAAGALLAVPMFIVIGSSAARIDEPFRDVKISGSEQ